MITLYMSEYNKLIKRYHDATEYFERKDIQNDDKEKQLENFQEILKALNYYLIRIKTYTVKQMLEGFK